jgi:hypothetical protein
MGAKQAKHAVSEIRPRIFVGDGNPLHSDAPSILCGAALACARRSCVIRAPVRCAMPEPRSVLSYPTSPPGMRGAIGTGFPGRGAFRRLRPDRGHAPAGGDDIAIPAFDLRTKSGPRSGSRSIRAEKGSCLPSAERDSVKPTVSPSRPWPRRL